MSRAFRDKLAIAFVVVALATQGSPASAQQANIDSGLAYLRSTQNADGSWGGTATSLHTVLQSTATATRSLQLLGVTDSSLSNALSFLSAQAPNTVEDLAQQVEVLAASGADVTTLVASLKAAQRGDGGWGIDLEQAFPSAVVDTLAAVRALTVANALDPTATVAALGFLLNNQNPDGGWGIVKDQPSQVFYTALALLALKEFQRAFDLSAPLTAGVQFVAARQNPDGSFGGSAFETALAFQALLRYTLNFSRSAALANLNSTQLTNGSWAEDAFSTALALRALKDAQTVAEAQIQAITLEKVDGTPQPTTTALAFETLAIDVTIADPTVRLEIIVQDSAGTVFSPRITGGQFFFDTRNLPPGTYTVIVRAIDPSTGIIIDQETITFTIEATIAVTNAILGVIPGFTQAGATETVTVSLSLTNRSNSPATLTIEHTVQSPSGTLLNSGVTPLPLSPEESTRSITLATFSHTFTESGEYPIQAKVLDGTKLLDTVTTTIVAAPAIRIDPSKTLTPQTVIPDGDKRIQIDIRLEGVEQQP